MENKIKFIDLFAGIGGFRIGFEKSGFECVFSAEINEHACEMYKENFGDNPQCDITQIDLPDGKKSGLKKVMHILRNVNDIAICKFDKKDVVRHKLVQDIVNAYQKYEEDKNNGRS